MNGERFRLSEGKVLSYHRVLDMQRAVLRREVYWQSPAGVGLRVATERFASLHDEHVGAIRYSVTIDEDQPATTGPIEIVLSASLNLAVGNYDLMHWESVAQYHEGEIAWLHSQTRKSTAQLAQTMTFSSARCDFHKELIRSDVSPMIRFYGVLAPGETLTTEKVVMMYTSRDVENPLATALEQHHSIMQAGGALTENGGHYTLHIEGITSEQPCEQTRVYEMLLADHQKACHRNQC